MNDEDEVQEEEDKIISRKISEFQSEDEFSFFLCIFLRGLV